MKTATSSRRERRPLLWSPQERGLALGVGLLSLAVGLGLLWLLKLAPAAGPPPAWTRDLPAWDAAFNATSALCLLAGWRAIRLGRKDLHRACMAMALVFSTAFLIGYVSFHRYHPETVFGAYNTWKRTAYLSLLFTHVLGSLFALPSVPWVLGLALLGRFERHRAWARWVLPLWLYVSVSGVLVFFFLKPYY